MAAPSYWKPAAQVRDQTGQGHSSDTVMTAATCKTQADQTTGINHSADTTSTTAASSCLAMALSAFSKHKLEPGLLFHFICELLIGKEPISPFILKVSQVVGSNL